MKYLFSFLSLFFYLSLTAQENCKIEGRITDENGNPIPYTSIYIPALAKGSMANIDGAYSFTVPCNTYEILFQSLGYEKKSIVKELSSVSEINVQLKTVTYQLQEVSIDPSSEDPAYNYIRKATAMAQYYRKQISSYTCNLYVRSFFDPENIPWIAKKLASEEDLADMSTGDITETLTEYSYERPNKVTEKVLASKSGSLDTLRSGSNYINLNFYNLGGSSIINPLSRNAFQVYKFEHIHTYFEGSRKVHKIKIIPRRKGNDLMRGHIYINDKIWNINNVDVEFEQTLSKIKYQQLYNEVRENVWMPTNHKITVRVAALGFEMDVNYLATLSNLKVQTDPEVDAQIIRNLNLAPPEEQEVTNIPGEVKPKLSKTEAKIEELLQKEKISKGESLKLVRLIKKQERELEKEEEDTLKSFEVNSFRKVEYADSAFSTNDSLWQKGRDIPLSERELNIYSARDSLERVQIGDTVINDSKQSTFSKILSFNGTVKTKNKNIRFQPNGLISGLNGYFSTVDGYTITKEIFTYEWNNRKGRFYRFTPTLGYAIARETFLGGIDYVSQYNYKKRAGFFGSVGRKSNDFNRENPNPVLVNTVTSLLFSENFKKYYQADYLTLGHQFDLANGLAFKLAFEYEDRVGLRNYSDSKWIDRDDEEYTPNFPVNREVLSNEVLLNDHQSFSMDVGLIYTPKSYYRYFGTEKQMLGSKYPTFGLNYRQGLEGIAGSDARYQFLSFSIQQTTKIQLLDRFTYHLEAGKFFNNQSTFFADYKNFNSQPSIFLGKDLPDNFYVLDNYTYNTNDHYFEAHLALEDNNLLLKKLPLFNRTSFSETISANYLITEQNVHYSEVGYSLNRIFLFVNLGVYAAFENDEFSTVGFRIGFKGFE